MEKYGWESRACSSLVYGFSCKSIEHKALKIKAEESSKERRSNEKSHKKRLTQ